MLWEEKLTGARGRKEGNPTKEGVALPPRAKKKARAGDDAENKH